MSIVIWTALRRRRDDEIARGAEHTGVGASSQAQTLPQAQTWPSQPLVQAQTLPPLTSPLPQTSSPPAQTLLQTHTNQPFPSTLLSESFDSGSIAPVKITGPLAELASGSCGNRGLEDIREMHLLILQRSALLEVTGSLIFVHDPAQSGPHTFSDSYQDDLIPNTGLFALKPNAPGNRPFLVHEAWFHTTIAHLKTIVRSDPELSSEGQDVIEAARKELERLEYIKGREWDLQRQIQRGVVKTHGSAPVVDNPMMHLLFNGSRRSVNVLAAGLRVISRSTLLALVALGADASITESVTAMVNDLPVNIRTVVGNLDLDPVTRPFVCCPECFALYSPTDPQAKVCTSKEFPDSVPCGTPLEKNRLFLGKSYEVPSRIYLNQDMKAWIGRMVSQPGLEDILDRAHPGPRTSDPDNEMHDIWDAPALYTIPDPEREREAFATPPPASGSAAPEGRYYFALAYDLFNPFQNKEAKQHVSVSALYMICLNLPPHLHFLPEYMYLVGVIPGPGEPSLEQVNHALRILVDDLLVFYSTGVFYVRTAKYTCGRLIRCALGPVVADLPAARKVSGFTSFSHTFFCSCCWTKRDDKENLDVDSWKKRTGDEHKARAREWRDATSKKTRNRIMNTYGVRWSELHRLPYWDPVLFTVVDSMHNLYLGILEDHCRVFWGMNATADDGDGAYAPQRNTYPLPEEQRMARAWFYVRDKDKDGLLRCTTAVVWHLCLALNLRHSNVRKKASLIDEVLEWHNSHTSLPQVAQDLIRKYPTILEQPESDLSDDKIAYVEATMARGTSAATIAKQADIEVLKYHCQKRSLPMSDDKKAMASTLIDWYKNLSPSAVAQRALSDATVKNRPAKEMLSSTVLGHAMLNAVWEDMKRTLLPSWISPAPRNVGTTERGKLSADHWRSLCTIHLPITLIRLWGSFPKESRQMQMLKNYMDLVTAVGIAGMLITSNVHIKAYRQAILRYLENAKVLYKECSFKPNHHLAIHLADVFLPNFGPFHPIRAFHTERNNFMLQKENTNMKFGELELTYMKHTCRSANMRLLLRDEVVSEAAEEVIAAYEVMQDEDRRGTRIRELFKKTRPPRARRKLVEIVLDEFVIALLLKWFENAGQTCTSNLSLRAISLSELQIQGVTYTSAQTNPKDSHAIYNATSEGRKAAGQIQRIFQHTRKVDGDSFTETFILVRPYIDLNADDAQHDKYRQFSWAGGKLYYEDLAKDAVLIRPSQIVSHFAKTPITVAGIARRCIHALPLDRMVHMSEGSSSDNVDENTEGNDDDESREVD
ncbi:hypothetical protein NM688_g7556 [Phlebia brevispora]|uniref:Uncharacterized protein n=1 Tax=Phlebia brevispora TaxID=194682 RepID=A0ACC1S3W7_9APHY|nr:hypothetical protein NM688_g7556 [Phlebia brevispora]